MNKIPMSKTMQNDAPNHFASHSLIGQAAGDVAYQDMPQIQTRGSWLLIVPFRPVRQGKIAVPETSVAKADSYLVIGTNSSTGIDLGSVVKIVESSKRSIPLESSLSKRFQDQPVFGLQADGVIWVLDEELSAHVV